MSSPQPSEIGDAKLCPEACILKCESSQYQSEAEDWDQPLVIALSGGSRGNFSIKCMTFVGKDRLWCGCGNTISVIDVNTLTVEASIPIFSKRAQLINELVSNGNKVWGIGRQLANVMQWDVETYELKCVFDCGRVDPTGNCLVCEPSTVEELALPEAARDQEDKSPSSSPQFLEDQREKSTSSEESANSRNVDSGFEVSNEPENPSKTPYAAYNAHLTRLSLRTVKRPPRDRALNITQQEGGKGIFGPRPTFDALKKAQIRSMLRQQGATRVTSILIVHDTLWIARGMGDVLIVDISEGKNHGIAIARLATEDSNKYGNRSNHKLCLIGKEYVVSSQWLEPLDLPRPRAPTDASLLGSLSEHSDVITAHQQITVWEAWDHDMIRTQALKISQMCDLDQLSLNDIDD